MVGSQIAEITLPLSFESQKRKIQKYPNNQLFYLNASKSRITYAYGILICHMYMPLAYAIWIRNTLVLASRGPWVIDIYLDI